MIEMEDLYGLMSLAAFVIFFYGLFLAVFRRGRRRLGLGVVALGVVALLYAAGELGEEVAVREGWASYADKSDAEKEGITDPAAWAAWQEAQAAAVALAEEQAAKAQKARVDELAAIAQAEEEEALAKAAAEAEASAEEAAREKRYGFNCLSGWDGSHRQLVSAVKERLNDPQSFQHGSTQTWPVRPDGQNQIVMLYRAKNGFGGMVLSKAVGTFDNESCDVSIESIE